MNNVFTKNKMFLVNYQGTKDYTTGLFERNYDPFVFQLESVTWNEKGTGYNEDDPNDCTDSLNYGASFYYNNPENINFGHIEEYYDMSKLL